jgi:hypothetical protein
MTKIKIAPDCGNAPRKIFLADLNKAFARGEVSFLNEHIPDNITFHIVGASEVSGKDEFLSMLTNGPYWKIMELTIDTIITHGRAASVSGEVVCKDGSRHSFCDIYQFKGAGGTTISKLTRFIIKVGKKTK